MSVIKQYFKKLIANRDNLPLRLVNRDILHLYKSILRDDVLYCSIVIL